MENTQTPTPPVAPTPPTPPKQGDNNMVAIFAYLGIFIVIPFLVAKDDPFVKFHIKQGLALLIFAIAASIIAIIPILGWLIGILAWLMTLVLVIIGIMNVVNAKQKDLPLIGKLAEKFNF